MMLSTIALNKWALFFISISMAVLVYAFGEGHSPVPASEKRLTLKDRVEFLNQIELVPQEDLLYELPVPDYSKKLFVDSGSFVTLSQHMSQQETQDVLNTTLFAQLAASHDYDKKTQMPQWYGKYAQVMSILGWDISDFDENNLTAAANDISVNKVILEILRTALMDQSDLAMIDDALSALSKLDNKSSFLSLFNRSAVEANGANFQSSFVTHDQHGLVSMNLGYLVVAFEEEVENILFVRVEEGRSSIRSTHETIKLDYDVFIQIRDLIVKKLGNNARTNVAGIDI